MVTLTGAAVVLVNETTVCGVVTVSVSGAAEVPAAGALGVGITLAVGAGAGADDCCGRAPAGGAGAALSACAAAEHAAPVHGRCCAAAAESAPRVTRGFGGGKMACHTNRKTTHRPSARKSRRSVV